MTSALSLSGSKLFVRQHGSLAKVGWPFERRPQHIDAGPDALQIGIAPRRARRSPRCRLGGRCGWPFSKTLSESQPLRNSYEGDQRSRAPGMPHVAAQDDLALWTFTFAIVAAVLPEKSGPDRTDHRPPTTGHLGPDHCFARCWRHCEALFHHQLAEQGSGTLPHFSGPSTVFVGHPEGNIQRRPSSAVLHVELGTLLGQISDE